MPTSTANDILEVLGEDHQEIGRRFAAMADVPSDRLAETFWRLIEILVHHEVAEEIVVYPALRTLPGDQGSPTPEPLSSRRWSTPWCLWTNSFQKVSSSPPK